MPIFFYCCFYINSERATVFGQFVEKTITTKIFVGQRFRLEKIQIQNNTTKTEREIEENRRKGINVKTKFEMVNGDGQL